MNQLSKTLNGIFDDWNDDRKGFVWVAYLGFVLLAWCVVAVFGIYMYVGMHTSWSFDNPGDLKYWSDKAALFLESIAPWILFSALFFYWIRAVITRNLSYLVMSAMVTCLLLREIHWDTGIKQIIFPLLGLWLVWFIRWRDIIDKPKDNKLHTIFFLGAIMLYGCCQIIEKRLLRNILPYEPSIHVGLEELSETVAHIFMLGASVLGSWTRRSISVFKR